MISTSLNVKTNSKNLTQLPYFLYHIENIFEKKEKVIKG